MDLSFTPDQVAVREAFARVYEKESPPERVRAAERTDGFDPALWDALVAVGAPTMGVPEPLGGGAALSDLALVAELHGRHLGSAPLLETMVATRLLARAGADDAVRATESGAVTTFHPRPWPGGAVLAASPGGAAARSIIACTDGTAVLVTGDARPLTDLGDAGLATIEVHTADRIDVDATAVAGADAEWRLLTAASLVGLGRRALELGVGYVKERTQFDVPIGSFQAIQHRLADALLGLDGAALLVRRAAWAGDRLDTDARSFARMAFSFAAEASQDAAQASLHFHGGYGFMEEYDIQLYARRAKAWSLAAGDPRREYQRLADELYGPRERP